MCNKCLLSLKPPEQFTSDRRPLLLPTGKIFIWPPGFNEKEDRRLSLTGLQADLGSEHLCTLGPEAGGKGLLVFGRRAK